MGVPRAARYVGARPHAVIWFILILLLGDLVVPGSLAEDASLRCGLTHGPSTSQPVQLEGAGGGVSAVTLSGFKQVLVIRVDFDDLPGAPFDEESGREILRHLHEFMGDASRGRIEFALAGEGSAVTPVLRMPLSAEFYGNNNLLGPLRQAARDAATAAGFEVGSYDYDIIAMGPVPGLNWNGLATIGAPGAWLRNTAAPDVALHEVGHNLGLTHANAWNTAERSVIGSGASLEYGDLFDIMGSGGAGRTFNTHSKWRLGWLDEAERIVLPTNGIYRIHAHDHPDSAGRTQALVLPHVNGTNYWLEFRSSIPENRWVGQGVLLRWALASNQSPLLLDTTPGTFQGRQDAPLTVGRTFSDPRLGLHLTVLQQGGDAPPWIEVRIQRDAFASNAPPSLRLAPVPDQVPPGTTLTFQVEAQDPEGDELAFSWDFGDGTFAGGPAAVEKTWTQPGLFRVQATASDSRGGTARASVLVQVGQGGLMRLEGQVRTPNLVPVSGARILIPGLGRVVTDEDGSYQWTGLSPGAYEVAAVADGYDVVPANFSNPLVIIDNLGGVDFTARRPEGVGARVLVPVGATWSYLDDGSMPPAPWVETDYDDSHWSVGRAQFGYGDGDETTLVDFGPFPNRKHVTTYFRHAFAVPDPARITRLHLGLLRDDGAAVHLNGQEVHRSNLPGGALRADTLALASAGAAEERTYQQVMLSPELLRPGRNVLAVEVHQHDEDSSDLGFDLYLEAGDVLDLAPGVELAQPGGGSHLIGPTNLTLFANAWAGPSAEIVRVDFYSGSDLIGADWDRPFLVGWSNVTFGVHDLTATAFDTSGRQWNSLPVRVVMGTNLLPPGSHWRYLDDGSSLPAAWTDPRWPDTTWASGPAPLGYGDGDEATVVSFGPDPANKHVTTYFRTSWQADLPGPAARLRFHVLCDDGAAVHLNGLELFRKNLPEDVLLNAATLALDSVGQPEENEFHEVWSSTAGLQGGFQTLAVEVHQASYGSSDLGFDLGVDAFPALPDPIWLGVSREGSRVRLSWPVDYGLWTLQVTDDPDAPDGWIDHAGPVSLAGDWYEVVLDATAPASFFRLLRR